MSSPILETQDVTIEYETPQGMLTAVSDASFTIEDDQYYGLVGESGCGKSTIAQAIMGGLDDNGQVTSGKILYNGKEIQNYDQEQLNEEIRWKEVSYIPQASMNSLDPLQTISHQAWKIAKTHSDMSKNEALDRFEEMFEIVGLQTSRINDYAHQFSGGMEQRAIIALALFLNPSLVIADEPTTALDVIMQDQIFKYLDDINEEIGTSMLLITHDISVVLETCEKMAVMHSGQVAERGLSTNLYDQPRHPYAIMLQEAFPDIRYPHRKLGVIDGHPPQTIDEKDYCTFVDRCPWAVEDCSQGAPQLEPIEETDGEHFAACIRKDEIHELYEANNASEGAVENEQITSTGGDVDD